MRTAFFHEDDYCQIELLPKSSQAFCLKQMGKIATFSDEHSSNIGFTDIYLRDETHHTLKELALSSKQLEKALDFLPSYDKVETGYSSYREECKSTCCVGERNELNVFWSQGDSGLVTTIWLDLWITPETKEKWYKILTSLGKLSPFILVDWSCNLLVDLTLDEKINEYLNDKNYE